MDPSTSNSYFTACFCNREGVCLLRGTSWIFKYDSCCMSYPQR